MQEAMIQAYLLRRGFPHGFTRGHDSLGWMPMDVYHKYREWVFAWAKELTEALPPR